jgi:hypothetical protein
MRRTGVISAALALLALDSVIAAPIPEDVPASLCRGPEVTIATCSIGKKLVSVCGWGEKQSVYRYGTPDQIELEALDPRISQQSFSGGGETQIHFTKGRFRYILYDRIFRSGFGADGHTDPQFSAGLLVQKNGRRLAERACATTKAAFIRSDRATRYLKASAYIEH